MMRAASFLCSISTIALLHIAFGLAATAEEWATLTGRFVYDGPVPERAKCNVTKDVAVCTKHHPLEEGLVVSEKGGLGNVLIWVRTDDVAVHPDFAKAAQNVVVFDNLNCRFAPHIATVRTGQPLRLSNSDAVGHNSLGLCRANPQFNENIPPGAKKDVVFQKAERLPFKIQCAIHPWMAGYVLVKEHPYMAVSGEDGSFKIENLPAGVPLEFQVWHETGGYVTQVTKGGAPAGWERGRFTVSLSEGKTDLGELLVDPAQFK